MRLRSFTTEGIILAKRNYSEADRIISIYTKNFGRLSFLAKGVRRPKSRKRGHLEVFSLVKIQASLSKSLPLLVEAETIDSYPQVRKDLRKISVAYYFMEVVGRTTHEGEEHNELFELIKEYLEKLSLEKNLKELRLDFIEKLLTILGFWPKGKALADPDRFLENVIERNISSVRVGKQLLT